jgi:hypothetical protein
MLNGCISAPANLGEKQINLSLQVDGQIKTVQIAYGSTIQQVLDIENLKLGNLDKVEPQLVEIAQDGLTVRVIRGKEVFETKTNFIPFERQTVRNESLPLGKTRLIQSGTNGTQEVVYRNYYEDDKLLSTSVFRSTILQQALPEIVMLGVQAPFNPLPIPGKLIYISAGNAWLMEGSTSKRVPLVTTGDLDGRILKLSKDTKWLLFTRKSNKSSDIEINTLWALDTTNPKASPINLMTSNVIHFADWDPTTGTTIIRVLYSTVEPRSASPGWQANNNLFRMVVGTNGNLGVREKIIEANTGGVYGWWGTDFKWSPTGNYLAYSRPDSIGIVSFKDKVLKPLISISPLQTHSDWALIPAMTWAGDGNILYYVTHAPPPGLVNPEESPNFDLSAYSLETSTTVHIVPQSGMFAYPSISSPHQFGKERSFYLAYLQSLTPIQSGTSSYKLMIMDRDGSNRHSIFPGPGSPGLSPQTPIWAPTPISYEEGDFIGVIYQGNLWLIDIATGKEHQVTGDGLIQKIEWQ